MWCELNNLCFHFLLTWQVKQDEIDELVYLEGEYCKLMAQSESYGGNYKASILLWTYLLGARPQSYGLRCAQAFVVKVRHWKYIRQLYWLWIFHSVGGIVARLRAAWPCKYGLIPGKGKIFFSSSKYSDRLWDPFTLLLDGYRGHFSHRWCGQSWSYCSVPVYCMFWVWLVLAKIIYLSTYLYLCVEFLYVVYWNNPHTHAEAVNVQQLRLG